MTIKLYNTLSRRKEVLKPIIAGKVGIYVCGPTVYDLAHIGNARPIIVFDVLFRLLRHVYGADNVTYVRNITDVDDKINARAAEEGVSIGEVTARTIAQFHKDIKALGVLAPTVEPRATDHIAEMKAMCETLVAKGHAYVAEGHVLFDVPSMPDYGRLSNRTLDEMKAGARVEVASYKKDPTDFVLWKPSKEGEPAWASPCGIKGPGRPGWHIECSAMAGKHLGEVFDIHGGGIDLAFPHHENEIAQSRCAHGTKMMANIWMHNGFLQVEGEKMSKSLGNFITINELLKDWPGDVLKFNMLRTHYRKPIDWTVKGLQESERALRKLRSQMQEPGVLSRIGTGDGSGKEYGGGSGSDHGDIDRSGYGGGAPGEDFIAALKDDLNTPFAITILHELEGAALAERMNLLGVTGKLTDPRAARMDEQAIADKIAARAAARTAKNWAEGDRIRDELAEMGIQLKDSKDPDSGEIVTTWEMKR